MAQREGLSPKAIIAVDLFGLPARYRLLQKIAKKNNLYLIEDAAQGFGGSIRNQLTCSFGNVATTSFFRQSRLDATEMVEQFLQMIMN